MVGEGQRLVIHPRSYILLGLFNIVCIAPQELLQDELSVEGPCWVEVETVDFIRACGFDEGGQFFEELRDGMVR